MYRCCSSKGCPLPPSLLQAEKHRNKRYNIAKELRDTEERCVHTHAHTCIYHTASTNPTLMSVCLPHTPLLSPPLPSSCLFHRYVSRLKLVAVDFYEAISAVNSDKKTVVPDSALHQIFLNIKPIYQFSTELLSELDRMLELWCVCVPALLPACLPSCLPSCLPALLPALLPACLPACPPACLPACLRALLPACLPASMHACECVRVHVGGV